MLKTASSQIASRVKQHLRTENSTLPQRVQIVKTRRQRKHGDTR
ncbi:MAG: hypothetical protein ABEJ60_04370 [Halodesulfurarchaeum sp.]